MLIQHRSLKSASKLMFRMNISILQQKLALTDLPNDLRDYGAPLGDIRSLVSRWKEGYDWKKHETELPQFTRDTEVEGHGTLNVHHSLGPGSFLEVRKFLPLLVQTDVEHLSFHVVVGRQ